MAFTFGWILFLLGFVAVLGMLAKLLWISGWDSVKKSPFECGFDPLSFSRLPFSIRFFLLLIVFLIFDVEIALFFPILYMMKGGSSFVLVFIVFSFLFILLIGLFHEWNEGSLSWSR